MSAAFYFLIGINTLIFLGLSGLHIYWAFGGKWGFESAIPKTENGQPAFTPGRFATLVVAFGLFVFAIITISNIGVFNLWLDYFRIGTWCIVVIFSLRAIGDFKQIGFFKKKDETIFALNDTKYYSPLCLYLGVSSLVILLIVDSNSF